MVFAYFLRETHFSISYVVFIADEDFADEIVALLWIRLKEIPTPVLVSIVPE